jgi:hypothetical protein
MHFAAQSIPSTLFARIVGLVMFGDPGNRGIGAIDPLGGTSPAFPTDLAAKLRENCAHNDPVCTNNGTMISAHLSYNNPGTAYMLDSAAYIQKQFQMDGQAGAQPAPEGPGSQTQENIAALQSLGSALGSKGVQQTCNSTASATTSANTTASATRSSSTMTASNAGKLVSM